MPFYVLIFLKITCEGEKTGCSARDRRAPESLKHIEQPDLFH